MKEESVKKILAETPRIYDAIASDFSDTRGYSWQGFGDFAKYVKAGDKVLDLGCGNGRMAQIFEDASVDYLGLDNSKELIEIAQERYKDKSWAKFGVFDITTNDWKLVRLGGENWKLIMLIAVLHHIPTREKRLKVLKDVYDILQPGGRLVISNWNLWKISGRKNFRYFPYLFNYAQKFQRGVYGFSDAFVPWKANLRQAEWHDRYIHSFGKRETKRLLEQAGFAVEEISYASKTGGHSNIFSGDNLLAVAVKK